MQILLVGLLVIAMVAAVAWALVVALQIDLERGGAVPEQKPDSLGPLANAANDFRISREIGKKERNVQLQDAKYRALERLKSLHEKGVISDEEFNAEKRALMG